MFKKKIFRCVAILFVIIETFPPIRGYIGVRDWIPMFFLIAVSFSLYPKFFFNKELFSLLLYLMVLLLFSFMGHTMGNKSWITAQILYPLACLSIISVFLDNHDIYGLKLVTLIGLFVAGITSVLTIIIVINSNNSDVVRDMVANSDINYVLKYQKRGMASYDMIHSLPFIYSLLVVHLKTKRKFIFKIFSLMLILMTFCMIIKSSFATPLILSVFVIFFSIVISKNQILNFLFGIIIVLCCLIYLNENLVISGLKTIQPIFQETRIARKIDDIVLSIKHESAEGSVARLDTTKMSWNAFLESPFWGNMDKEKAGGHSFILDRLAYFGIIGIIPFVVFLSLVFKRHFNFMNKNIRVYYLLSLFVFILLGCLKNLGGVEPFLYLFVFLPGISSFISPAKT